VFTRHVSPCVTKLIAELKECCTKLVIAWDVVVIHACSQSLLMGGTSETNIMYQMFLRISIVNNTRAPCITERSCSIAIYKIVLIHLI